MVGEQKNCLPSLRLRFKEVAWNDVKVAWNVNCYAYALNCPEMGCAIPGGLMRAEEYTRAELSALIVTVPSMTEALVRDGLRPLTRAEAFSGEFHAIALRVAPAAADFHFLRFHPGETLFWSHKFAPRLPSRTDDDECLIRDPARVCIGGYKEFGGYFGVPAEGVKYIQRFDVPPALKWQR